MTIDLANACVGWEMHIYTVALLIYIVCVYRREEVQSCRVCKCTRSALCCIVSSEKSFVMQKGFLARFGKITLFLLI